MTCLEDISSGHSVQENEVHDSENCHDPSLEPRRDMVQREPERTPSKPLSTSLHILDRGSNKLAIKE